MNDARNILPLAMLHALVLLSQFAYAEVYLQRPERGQADEKTGAAKFAGNISEALSPRRLWTEEIVANGETIMMDIALLEKNLSEALRSVKSMFPLAKLSANANSFMAELREADGRRRRIYVVELGAFFPCVQFSAVLPESLPSEFAVSQELENLLPPESKLERCYYMPKRNSICATFECAFEPGIAMSMIKIRAATLGWNPLDDIENSRSASGFATFIQSKPSRILLADVKSRGASGSVGTIVIKDF